MSHDVKIAAAITNALMVIEINSMITNLTMIRLYTHA